MAASLRYGQMTLTVEIVDATTAAAWLEKNKGNRRLRPHLVNQYERDQRDGAWEKKPLAICFDDVNGSLGNGQHTLAAIVQSGVPQELLIARNVPRRAIAMMDMGLRRTLADVGGFLGAEFTGKRAAVSKALVFGVGDQRSRSFDEVFGAYQQHQDVIDFVCGHAKKAVGFSAATLAVVAAAAYTEDRTRLARFLDVMHTGVSAGPHESAAIKLRDHCSEVRGAGSGTLRLMIFQKSKSALRSFLDGVPMSKLYGTADDLFPLPVQK